MHGIEEGERDKLHFERVLSKRKKSIERVTAMAFLCTF